MNTKYENGTMYQLTRDVVISEAGKYRTLKKGWTFLYAGGEFVYLQGKATIKLAMVLELDRTESPLFAPYNEKQRKGGFAKLQKHGLKSYSDMGKASGRARRKKVGKKK